MSEGNREDLQVSMDEIANQIEKDIQEKKDSKIHLDSRWFKNVKTESGDQEIKEIEDLMKKTPKQYGIYAAIALVIIIILSNL